jgi:hypothetical protein
VTDWSYTILTVGNSRFIRGVSVPLSEALEAEFPGRQVDLGEEEVRPPLPKGVPVNALPTAFEAIVGVLVFLGAWGAKRFLDDVYELTIRPHVRRILRTDHDATPSTAEAPRAFMLAIGHISQQRMVIVVAIAKSPTEFAQSEELIAQVHREACQLLEKGSRTEPVVLYAITAGDCSGPSFFESIGQALHFLQNLDCSVARREDAR